MAGKQIYAALQAVQRDLKAPKGQFNSFGKYKYRSCEDIVEAVKPLLNDNGLILVMADEVIEVGGRIYIKATSKVIDVATGDSIEATAMAREPDEKKGMDTSQITGTASSYARKYSLNGLFAIDDTKDADTDAFTAQTKQEPPKAPAPDDTVRKAAMARLNKQIKRLGYDKDELVTIAKHVTGKTATKDMNADELSKLAEYLEGEKNEKNEKKAV